MSKRPKSDHPKAEGGAWSVTSRDATSGRYIAVNSTKATSGPYAAVKATKLATDRNAALPKEPKTAGVAHSADAARTNAALREGGIDYQVESGQDFDAKAFTKAALRRWQKVAARLAE